MFTERLRGAARAARDFGRRFVEEELPDAVRFRVRLNSSYDGHPLHADERVYPEDGAPERARETRECTEEQIERLLWRDGAVPEWVDLSVIGVVEGATLIEALCCGRFTTNEALLYHEQEGLPPFHVVSPTLPVEHEEGRRFSIHDRTECWRDDVERISGYAHKIRALELVGADDASLELLPALSRMERLDLKDSRVSRLGALRRYPGLGSLRIHFASPSRIEDLPVLPELKALDVQNLAAERWDLGRVVGACPKLGDVTVQGAGELILGGALRDLESLSITAERLSGDLRLPRRIENLTVQLRDATGLDRMCEGVESVDCLSLHGTPVKDAWLEQVGKRWRLARLNAIDTGVSEDLIRRLVATTPKLRIRPNPKSS